MGEVSGLAVFFGQAVATEVGLNPSDLEALEILLRRGAVTAGALAQATGLTTGAITGVVDRLERADLAQRRPDPADRRRVVIAAKPGPALERVQQPYSSLDAAMRRLLSQYDEPDLARLNQFLQEAIAITKSEIATINAREDR